MSDQVAWNIVVFSGVKPHIVPTYLCDLLVEDIDERFGRQETAVFQRDEAFIDRPGMVLMDRSYQVLDVGDLAVKFPTTDFEYFYEHLKATPQRKFSDGRTSYYKLHGWIHALVLTSEHRDNLLAVMREMLPAIKLQAAKENQDLLNRLSSPRG